MPLQMKMRVNGCNQIACRHSPSLSGANLTNGASAHMHLQKKKKTRQLKTKVVHANYLMSSYMFGYRTQLHMISQRDPRPAFKEEVALVPVNVVV